MSFWILDTNHINVLHGYQFNVQKKLVEVTRDDVAITIITAKELIDGWYKIINEKNIKPERLIYAYAGLKITIEYLREVDILDFDPKACEIYLDLSKKIKNIGTQDLQIAAIALAVNGIVVTRNQKDFAKIPNLKIEDWTTEIS